MHSNMNNNEGKKPTKLLYLEKASIVDSVVDMVRTGESNVGFMLEVIYANWPNVSRKDAQRLVLEGINKASSN
jgi:hypothetical protein